MRFVPHPYQSRAIDKIVNQPRVGLFLEMGLGKTVITLTAISELLMLGEARRVLIIAPLRVAATVWAEEAEKWDHTRGLRCAKVLGTAGERRRVLSAEADLYIINRENVPWLIDEVGRGWSFDTVVIDELSSFKSIQAARWKALRRVLPRVKRVIGLTGTPAPNGLLDLWPQAYLLDGGEALGKTYGGYKDRYFDPGRRNGAIVYDWRLKPGAEEAIHRALEGLCLSMTAEEYLSLPERLDVEVPVPLPRTALSLYEELRKQLVAELGDRTVITAASAAVLSGKLLQLTAGTVYDEQGTDSPVHTAKLDALSDLVESANGQPVLVYHYYRSELRRLKERFPEAVELRGSDEVNDWNAGKVRLLLAHPASAGHGLNLQIGGHIMVWTTLPWSLELYQQACARLHRQGQREPVTVYHLLAPGTVDEQVLKVLRGKATVQDALMEALR